MEDELIRRAQLGDTIAFRALVESYTPGAWRVARVLIPNTEQAEDALQEAWIDVWRGLPRFDNARPLRPWLLAIVGNRCRMQRRRHTPRTESLNEQIADEVVDQQDVYEDATARELDPALRAALRRLAPEERELLTLRYQAELELSEIAALYDAPLSTIKSRLYRTLARLRESLTAETAIEATETK